MVFLDSTELTDLLGKIKSFFVSKTDTAEVSAVDVDSTPTQNSTNLVTSGGVYLALPTTMGASGSGHSAGLVPDTPSTAGTTKFLREDGQWTVPAGGGSVPENVALLEDTDSTAYSPDFDPEAHTVHITAQTLTSAQQAQARTNIGAADASTAVNSVAIRNIVTISQADYDNLQSKDNNTLYIIT